MTIKLPFDPELVAAIPFFRVLYRDKFRDTEQTSASEQQKSDTDWISISEPTGLINSFGVELLTIDRRSLPDIGIASFRFLTGRMIDGTVVGQVYFLKNKEVRLQLSADNIIWKTVFWGKVDYEERQVFSGDTNVSGAIIYHCVDGFARTTKWFMDRHSFDGDGVVADIIDGAYGNPGYNYQETQDSILLGNKSNNSPVNFSRSHNPPAHTWQGAFSVNDPTNTAYKWTERQAIEHATEMTRPNGEPWFSFDTTPGVNIHFGSFTPIPTSITETVHMFVGKVANPTRGRGIVFVDWLDQSNGSIKVFLNFCPLFQDDLVVNYPSAGGTVTLPGAVGCGKYYIDITASDWDLEGDQRNIDDEFIISDAEMQQNDMVETISEQIEVAATLSYRDTSATVSSIYSPGSNSSLAPRWSIADVTSFEGLTVNQRNMSYWDHVYQAHGLPRNWKGSTGDALGGTPARVDFRCGDDGSILVPVAGLPDTMYTSPGSVELCATLPFYYGYRYDGLNPVKTDTSVEYGMPSRRRAMVFLRATDTSQDRWFYPMGSMSTADIDDKYNFNSFLGNFQPELSIQPDAVLCMSPYFMDVGLRIFADNSREATLSSNKKVGSTYDITRLAFTVTLRMPHRVRMASYAGGASDQYSARRKKTLYIPGIHLWLASYNCIWDLEQTSVSQEGYVARRGAAGSTISSPGKLRDDRDRLAIIHAIASQYFLTARRRIRVSQKYCGLMPFKRCVTGDPLVFVDDTAPIMGKFIGSLQFCGNLEIVATPVSRIIYNHQEGKTTWSTDWFDLNFQL